MPNCVQAALAEAKASAEAEAEAEASNGEEAVEIEQMSVKELKKLIKRSGVDAATVAAMIDKDELVRAARHALESGGCGAGRAAAPEWEVATADDGRTYYYNTQARATPRAEDRAVL